MTLKQNKTPWYAYAIWAAAMAAAIIIAAFAFHPDVIVYVVAGGIWLTGIGIMVGQTIKSGDTTMLPYNVQTLGAIVFWIWSTAS